jgi:hypothetical protein
MNISTQPICKIDKIGNKYWYLNDKLHREDGPAVEFKFGTNGWYLNGIRHRLDGPAIEFSDGTKVWMLNGIEYFNLNKFCAAANITGAEKTFFFLKWANLHG